jgi:hypothetical protein
MDNIKDEKSGNQKSALICVHPRLMKLKKQSQFIERSNVVILLIAMAYGDFGG